jgi:hypothetical protein
MNLAEIQDKLIGNWAGKNLLRLSWMTPSDYYSDTLLSVAPVAKDRFLTFTYTWSHENGSHEGLILLGHDQGQGVATAAWVDSWHQSAKVMACEGAIDHKGVISVLGHYEAPPGPDWGWRITIASDTGKDLRIVMHNCAPEGAEELAVQADYTRVS